MEQIATKTEIFNQLQQEILRLQGLSKPTTGSAIRTGLGPVEAACPGGVFPMAAVHEFLSYQKEHAAATNGFISGILGRLMLSGGSCLWIGNKRTIFPAAMKIFGLEPDRIIFLDLEREKDVLWATEEALKCEGLAAVVSELSELSFTESRRLQLAVEQSHVTGFIHRYYPRKENTVACVSRWRILPLASEMDSNLPGIGFPRWNVELRKIKNGRPGTWQFEWSDTGFRHLSTAIPVAISQKVSQTG